MLQVYLSEGSHSPDATQRQLQVISNYLYLPTTLLLVAPFAMLSWGFANLLWMPLTAAGLIFASYLMWKVGADSAPVLSGCLIGFLLANCSVLLATGNAAGIVVSLCTVAVWCFLNEKYVPAGVLCLATSLVIKPHDAGLVWLYFLLAGRVYRRRALQALAFSGALGLAAFAWISRVSPNWWQELRSNITKLSGHGQLNDLGPAGVGQSSLDMKIGLQTIISIFRNDPHIYNEVTFLVCGAFLLAWAVTTLRSRFSPNGAWFALAAIAPLTMLVTYHRSYDAKLLLLTIPACAMLWAKGGPIGWLALLINTLGFILTGEITMQALDTLDRRLQLSGVGLSGRILTVIVGRPITLILFVMSIFYLWVYIRGKSRGYFGCGPEGYPE